MTATGDSTVRKGRAQARFTGIERTNRARFAREQLEQAICRGDVKPGDRLPSERELVDMLGVSRVSVREAMRSLEALGLVEVSQGRGCFVADSRAAAYAGDFGRWLAAHRDEVLDLLRVRGALEELAAEAAAARGDSRAVACVRAASERFAAAATREAPAPLERLVELDIAFHEEVAATSGIPLLVDLLHDLNTYLTESRYVVMAPHGRPRVSASEHERIVAAIAEGRPANAKIAAARHIESVREAVRKLTYDGRETA